MKVTKSLHDDGFYTILKFETFTEWNKAYKEVRKNVSYTSLWSNSDRLEIMYFQTNQF